jgi:hypothetical protein
MQSAIPQNTTTEIVVNLRRFIRAPFVGDRSAWIRQAVRSQTYSFCHPGHIRPTSIRILVAVKYADATGSARPSFFRFVSHLHGQIWARSFVRVADFCGRCQGEPLRTSWASNLPSLDATTITGLRLFRQCAIVNRLALASLAVC